MEVKVKTLHEDGSVAFEGSLNKEQVEFVLQVGINFLLMNGAMDFLPDEDDEDEDTFEAPSTATVQ